jgi:hypothetical protein
MAAWQLQLEETSTPPLKTERVVPEGRPDQHARSSTARDPAKGPLLAASAEDCSAGGMARSSVTGVATPDMDSSGGG